MADDFSEKLNAVLGNSEAMGQIMSLARSLTGEGGEPPHDTPPEPAEEGSLPAVVQPAQALPDFSGLMGMLGGLLGGGQQGTNASDPLSALSNLDPRLIQLGMGLLSEYSREDDRKTALLAALKPFLREERAAKIERAAQAAKLSRLVRVALRLFKEGGGDHI